MSAPRDFRAFARVRRWRLRSRLAPIATPSSEVYYQRKATFVTRPQIRLRKESFGYVLALHSGHIGLYSDAVGPALLKGATQASIEPYRLDTVSVPKQFHLSAPLIVWFELTRACNLACKHCYVDAGPPRSDELTTQEVFDALNQLRDVGVFAVVLVGGEPMLRPDFLPILHHADQLGFIISIAT